MVVIEPADGIGSPLSLVNNALDTSKFRALGGGWAG